MKKTSLLFRMLAAAGVMAYLLMVPGYLKANLGVNQYDEWMEPHTEAYSGVITVWHVAGFRPYSGTLTAVLTAAAKRIEKRHHGVFINVIGMSSEEYALRIDRGEKPDIISFPLGLCYPEQFAALGASPVKMQGNLSACGKWNGEIFAQPYCYSPELIYINTKLAGEKGISIPDGAVSADWLNDAAAKLTYTYGRKQKLMMHGLAADATTACVFGVEQSVADDVALFKSGDAAMAISGVRLAADIAALRTSGKGFTYGSMCLGSYKSLVQLAGISASIDEAKKAYAEEFVGSLLDGNTQKALAKIGLMPAVQGEYEAPEALRETLKSAAEAPLIPNAFLFRRYASELEETAKRIQSGDKSAHASFDARLKELVNGNQIQ